MIFYKYVICVTFLYLILYSSFERGTLNVHKIWEDIKPRFTQDNERNFRFSFDACL